MTGPAADGIARSPLRILIFVVVVFGVLPPTMDVITYWLFGSPALPATTADWVRIGATRLGLGGFAVWISARVWRIDRPRLRMWALGCLAWFALGALAALPRPNRPYAVWLALQVVTALLLGTLTWLAWLPFSGRSPPAPIRVIPDSQGDRPT